MTTVRSFAALFDEQHRILCVRRAHSPHDWTLPGGKLDKRESPLEGLEREVREESGWSVRAVRLIGAYFARYKDDLALLFEVESTGWEEWKPDHEIAEARFFSRNSLPTPLSPEARVRIDDAFDERSGVMRVFDEQPASV